MIPLTVFDEDPRKGGDTTARRVNCPGDPISLTSLGASVHSWSGSTWKDDIRKGDNLESASGIFGDWEPDDHSQEMPASFSEAEYLVPFVTSLRAGSAPLPNFAHATEHGVRPIWVLKKPITDKDQFIEVTERLALDYGLDLAATTASSVFRAKDHILRFPVHAMEPEPLDVEAYLHQDPQWAAYDGSSSDPVYQEALGILGLSMGPQKATGCPHDGHVTPEDKSIYVNDWGIYCHSRHGSIPRRDVIKAAGLPYSDAYLSLVDIARFEAGRFVPRDTLEQMLSWEIEQRWNWTGKRLQVAVRRLADWAIHHCDHGGKWDALFEPLFGRHYPWKTHEYWSPMGLVHRPLEVEPQIKRAGKTRPCYEFEKLSPRKKTDKPLVKSIAPRLHYITGKGEVRESADVDRFHSGEIDAVKKSSLTVIDTPDRPVYGITESWSIKKGDIPRHIVPVRFTCRSSGGSEIVDKFTEDLINTFPYKNDEQHAAHVGYYLQPMLVPLMAGLFPAYVFLGLTKSGKGYSASGIPQWLYHNSCGDPVIVKRLPKSDYENEVMQSGLEGKIYITFDEVVDAKDDQFKLLDCMITQPSLHARKLRVGYFTIPNHFTIALTAVSRVFSDETAGRLVEIEFTESRPDEIAKFHERWSGKGPELLRALYDRVSDVSLDDIPSVSDRRPGFGVLQKVLKDGFGLDCTYSINHGPNDILDDICRMHRDPLANGKDIGKWTRYTKRSFSDFYNDQPGKSMHQSTLTMMITTALGYGSTEKHPDYKQQGYQADDENMYHVKFENEGKGQNSRKYIYIRYAGSPPAEVISEPDPADFIQDTGPIVMPSSGSQPIIKIDYTKDDNSA